MVHSGRVTAPFTDASDILTAAVAARAFPAAVIEVGSSAQPVWSRAVGTLTYDSGSAPARDDTIFDLASLTKVLATTPLVMRLVERGRLGLDDPVAQHLQSWRGADRESVTIRDLLSHSSGLPAYAPYYQTLRGRSGDRSRHLRDAARVRPRATSIYSDLGFMLLGFVLEDVAPLESQFDALRVQMQNPEDLQFLPPGHLEERVPRRLATATTARALLVGEVDDENAWALGGAAGHAGLFGTAAAVGAYARHIMQVLSGRVGAFQPETVRAFVTRRDDVPGSSRALGWDTMLPTSSCGTRMSAARLWPHRIHGNVALD